MIAVTFALPDESGVFLKPPGDLRRVSGGPLPVYIGTVGEIKIAVLHTGVGPESAAGRLQAFIAEHHPTIVVSSGFAGGLDPVLQPGSILLAENYSTPALFESARLLFLDDPSVFAGSLTTQVDPVESVSQKSALAVQTGALAVDMETSVLAGICAAAEIPFLSIRVISDTATQRLPVPFSNWFDAVNQKAKPGLLLTYLAWHPSVIPEFVRFVRAVFQAKKSLAVHLSRLLVHLKDQKWSKLRVVHKAD